jgi:beta-lactamase regulating signal transducer with metallopeptidase domain
MPDVATAFAIALKTSVLILIVGAVALASRRSSAAYRHALWTMALALSVLMPLAVLSVPSLSIIPAPWALPDSIRPMEVVAGLGRASPGATDPTFAVRGPLPHVGSIVWQVWWIGALGVLLRNVVARVVLMRLRRRARPLHSVRWAASLRRASAELRFTRPLQVLESEQPAALCTWGFVRPVLLLPASGDAWPERQRRHALLHELTHIRRNDDLTCALIRLACIVHWYNPLVWVVAREVRRLQEQACDDAVLRAGGKPSDYAEFLLAFARVADDGGRLGAAMGAVRRSELHDRLIAILDPAQPRVRLRGPAVVAALIPATCLMLLLAAVSPASASPPEARAENEKMGPATPAAPPPVVPATPAVPPTPAIPATPAVPALPAVPAAPAAPPTPTPSQPLTPIERFTLSLANPAIAAEAGTTRPDA